MPKPLADFDWSWTKRIDLDALEDLFSLRFVEEGVNAVLLGHRVHRRARRRLGVSGRA